MAGTFCINVPRESILHHYFWNGLSCGLGFAFFSYRIRMGWCLVVAVRCKVGCWKLAGR